MDRKGSKIFVADPSGTYVSYAAVAIGGNSEEVTDFLEKNYSDNMSFEDMASLAVAAINLKSEEKNAKHIKMSSVKPDAKILERISEQELEKYAQTAATKFVAKS